MSEFFGAVENAMETEEEFRNWCPGNRNTLTEDEEEAMTNLALSLGL